MKKKHIKGIKTLAEKLPRSITIVKYSVLKKGWELTEKEIESAKFEIQADKEYLQRNHYKVVEINHFNRLKKAFSKNGEQGIIDYIVWVDKNNRKMNVIFGNTDLKPGEDNLLKGALKGASGFWDNLFAFLFSFITVFKNRLAHGSNTIR